MAISTTMATKGRVLAIRTNLDTLFRMQIAQKELPAERTAALLRAIPETCRDQVLAILQEFADKEATDAGDIAQLEACIKAETVALGASVKGTFLQASYVRGRVTWDTTALTKRAETDPTLLTCRHQGDPSVRVQPVAKQVKHTPTLYDLHVS